MVICSCVILFQKWPFTRRLFYKVNGGKRCVGFCGRDKSWGLIFFTVFRSLLKANALEVRPIVRLALDILTPILPTRMEDGYRMLTHWTKKILLEEGHSMPQLVHMLQLIVRHYKVGRLAGGEEWVKKKESYGWYFVLGVLSRSTQTDS